MRPEQHLSVEMDAGWQILSIRQSPHLIWDYTSLCRSQVDKNLCPHDGFSYLTGQNGEPRQIHSPQAGVPDHCVGVVLGEAQLWERLSLAALLHVFRVKKAHKLISELKSMIGSINQ